MFGETEFHPDRCYAAAPLEEQLEALAAGAAAGMIRHVGLSNETPWGLMQACRLGMLAAAHQKVNFCTGLHLILWNQNSFLRCIAVQMHLFCSTSHQTFAAILGSSHGCLQQRRVRPAQASFHTERIQVRINA